MRFKDQHKHTNLDHEITGSYYQDDNKINWSVVLVVGVIIVACSLIYLVASLISV